MAVRVLPVAPFTVVNLVAGASHIRLRDFALGTVLGMAPGIAAVSVFADRLLAALHEPSTATLVGLAVVVAAIVAGAVAVRRWIRRRSAGAGAGRSDAAAPGGA